MNKQQLKDLEERLGKGANLLRVDSDLKMNEYSTPVMGLIFLKFADNKYSQYEGEILSDFRKLKGTRMEREIQEIALEKCGIYLPDNARYDYLLNLPEEEAVDQKIKEAMAAIEEYKPELKGVLPQDEYFRLTRTEDKSLPSKLLRLFSDIPRDASGDIFGHIYEFFLGEFALAEGQGGGEFYTPRSVVQLMVRIIEPYGGTVYDPACGSGGMFVQSAHFVETHRHENQNGNGGDLFVYGQEKTLETVKLAKMNVAVNGMRGDIRQANSYYEDPFNGLGKFDYILTNPPFNVDDVNYSRIENDKRFSTYGIPRTKTKAKKKDQGNETVPNANYLWINLFATSLKPGGRAGLVMANSASDARHSEADIRKTLIENNLIYGMITLPSNMFYTVTLPATLWFFDKAKDDDRILFIDARNIFTQIDRAHREFSPEQIKNIAIISRLHKGKREQFTGLIDEYFTLGMESLKENKERVKPVSEKLKNVLTDEEGKQTVADLQKQLDCFVVLDKKYELYLSDTENQGTVESKNTAQRQLGEEFQPYFDELHSGLKQLDKIVRAHEKAKKEANGGRYNADKNTKDLKTALEELHREVKSAESYFTHIHWLQERFPNAEYEDVIGLCRLATLDEVKEQDYSLNPGRYVGVVIEEDGKTEEEFISEILSFNDELEDLNKKSHALEKIIAQNIKTIAGDI